MPRLLYLPVGRVAFDLAAARTLVAATRALLQELGITPIAPDELLTTTEALADFVQRPAAAGADLVLFQNTTFVGGDFIATVAAHHTGPVVVWALREPGLGGRLRLNSLTGANSACHTLRTLGRRGDFWLGNPGEPRIRRRLAAIWRALGVARRLATGLKIGVVGEPPPGFAFCGADPVALRAATGVELCRLDLRTLFRTAPDVPEAAWRTTLTQAAAQVKDLALEAPTTVKFAQAATRLLQFCREENLGALAIRCWPEWVQEFGAAACSSLSFLTEIGLPAACESDVHGALSMFIARELADGAPPYLGDLVHVDEAANSVVFWHCGAGAFSLAHPATGARAGVHPNNRTGLTLEFGLKPGPVTLCRLSCVAGRYRLLILAGEAMDSPQRFQGTTVEVRLPAPAAALVEDLFQEGFEPHYALVHGDRVEELAALARLLALDHMVYAAASSGVGGSKRRYPSD
ncbi:MAG: hypothetical protein HZC55_03165 [Verrucomicrobia bacterium]|nr:hypothetical protein [Verrucomicrobiota bacterium]